MYYMFKEKNIPPSESYKMKHGERLIATAFLQREIEEKNKEEEMIKKAMESNS